MKNFKNKTISIKAISVLFLLMAIWGSDLKAQEVDNKQDTTLKKQNTRTSIYFHPLTFISTAVLNSDSDSDAFLKTFLYLTIENPIDLSKSLIFKPSLLVFQEFKIFSPSDDIFRFGADVGLRHYADKKGDGFYSQVQTGIFYLYKIGKDNRKNKNGVWFDIMGYLGYSKKYAKVSIFFDIGMGLGLTSLRDLNILTVPIGERSFLLSDINLGIGFSLGN